MPPSLFTFPKSEHLVSKKDLDVLFSHGKHIFTAFPVRVVYRNIEEGEFPVKVMVSVGKRHFKHAVDRNRAKRQIREAYRLNKHSLWDILEQKGEHLHLALIWLSDEPQPSSVVTPAVQKLLQLISERQ